MYRLLKEVPGFEHCDDLIIYDDGTLSVKSTGFRYRPLKDSKGYYYYDFRGRNAKYKCPKVHRLVMLAFSPDPPLEQINHIDGNKANNRLDNLEWCTNHQNRTHALRTGLKNEVQYGVAQYDMDGNLIRTYDTCCEALKALGKNHTQSGNIDRAIRGFRKTSYGYIWKQCEGSTTIPNGSTAK